MNDIYFDKNYGKLYEKIENGICEVFEYENSYGKIKYLFIKREIPIEVDNIKYYDLITPYGYGGPIIEYCLEECKEKLVEEFFLEFEKYCTSNNIVSEFVRFHPILNNALDFKNVYNILYNRKTLGTNIKKFENPFESEFSKSCRKSVRQSISKGVTYKIEKYPNDLKEFVKIYFSTMHRNRAVDYYYFYEEYFSNCLKYFKKNIILVNAIYNDITIASGMYFIFNKIIHVHLSGTLNEYLELSPAYVLKYATTIWAKENDYDLIHYGGGKSSSESDSLYIFKKKFSKNTEFDFYIAKKIWNKDIYDKLCTVTNNDINSDFFPAYRNF